MIRIVTLNQGERSVPAVVVAENPDGSVALFAPEGPDSDSVKYFQHVDGGPGVGQYS